MKFPAILKSPYFLLVIAIIVVIVIVGRRDMYTWRVGSDKLPDNAFWSDPKRVTVVTSDGVFMSNEDSRTLPIKSTRVIKPFTNCYSNVATGTKTCFKSPLM
jgi:hypothetical protein